MLFAEADRSGGPNREGFRESARGHVLKCPHCGEHIKMSGQGGKSDKRQKMLEKYDADGDGELSTQERQNARNDIEERMQERADKHFEQMDANGDGNISREEFDAALKNRHQNRQEQKEENREQKKERREKMLERFDSDGDGKLSKEERQAMRETLKENKGQGAGGDWE